MEEDETQVRRDSPPSSMSVFILSLSLSHYLSPTLAIIFLVGRYSYSFSVHFYVCVVGEFSKVLSNNTTTTTSTMANVVWLVSSGGLG